MIELLALDTILIVALILWAWYTERRISRLERYAKSVTDALWQVARYNPDVAQILDSLTRRVRTL